MGILLVTDSLKTYGLSQVTGLSPVCFLGRLYFDASPFTTVILTGQYTGQCPGDD